MARLTDLNMTSIAMVTTMAEGNPGALRVLFEFMKFEPLIDPDNLMGGLGKILALDDLGVYGSRIWMLYKDVCGEDIGRTSALLRARQLGIISSDVLRNAIENYGEGVDVEIAVASVQKELPKFNVKAWREE